MFLLKFIFFILVFWLILGIIVRIALRLFSKKFFENQGKEKKQDDKQVIISPKDDYDQTEQADFEELN